MEEKQNHKILSPIIQKYEKKDPHSPDPQDNAAHFEFTDLFDIDEIQKIQDAFADAASVASIITFPDGQPITKPSNFCFLCSELIRKTEKGRSNCYYSDSVIGRHNPIGPIVQQCLSGGLLDAGASITVAGKHIANWLIGQVRNYSLDEDQLIKHAEEIGVDPAKYKQAFEQVPVMPKERFEKIANALFIIANKLSSEAYLNMQQSQFINERKQVEKALQASEEKFRKAFYTSPDSICITRFSDGNFISVNRGFTKITGYSEEEVIGRTSKEIKIWNDLKLRKKLVNGLKKDGIIENLEARFQMKNGTMRQGLMSAVLIDLNGIPHIISITRDITERKIAEEELIKAKSEAEKANRLKSEFLTQMSHEIRTPLNSILSFSSLLREELNGKIPEELQSAFQIIDNSGMRLIRTIDMILDMSLFYTGSFEYTFSSVDLLNGFFEDIILEFDHKAKEKNLKINFEKRLDSAVVYRDSYTLKQIFINLIDNAIKYTRNGKIDIVLYKNEKEDICIDIKDTGIGISKEYLPHLFSPFMQEDRGYSRKFDGNGLGLALVKKYIEINKAKIIVQSEKKIGSTFTVILLND